MPGREVLRIVVAAFLLHGGIIYAAESTGLRKIRSAITSISGSMSPSWAGHESGIFAKHGLQVEVVAMPSGLQGITTLAAREVDFVHIAGGTTAGAAIGGLDVKIVATLVGTLVLNLVVRPESKSQNNCAARPSASAATAPRCIPARASPCATLV
jgi:ABC-type nitrate/sulfonate/bicarbonate transport system substrate-binding protein